MSEQVVYLDSSAIVKRYIREEGSDTVRRLYLRAYVGEATLSYSTWNIGEVLGALDRAVRLGRVSREVYSLVRRRFLLETRRMAKLGILIPVPVKLRILRECWSLIEKHHIYQADALQIASAKYVNADQFLTADGKLHRVAVEEGLNSTQL
ncbi:MAG: type II toxin-antitoxin system VapC family toxin [Thermoproteales archaeon]|nr:type II toxin-antitoxin system VapC family toxin [Thermoproteales archaeon]